MQQKYDDLDLRKITQQRFSPSKLEGHMGPVTNSVTSKVMILSLQLQDLTKLHEHEEKTAKYFK